MISGIVTDRHAIVALTFLLPNGSTVPIEFVIDTGFTGELCLPSEAVSLMGLTFRHDTFANLADNSEVSLPLYEAIVLWDGMERDILVVATGRRPLIGTALLDEQELVIQFTEGGLVTIDEL
ncbi:MAG: clan AA aspartic protease [Leptolyngbyaceae cyanobacterium bins.302]|nr:clan AA aspartic protease [Leptolyngbyaceae cyanobacterium bins.302]